MVQKIFSERLVCSRAVSDAKSAIVCFAGSALQTLLPLLCGVYTRSVHTWNNSLPMRLTYSWKVDLCYILSPTSPVILQDRPTNGLERITALVIATWEIQTRTTIVGWNLSSEGEKKKKEEEEKEGKGEGEDVEGQEEKK